jgi:hypothetical protein
MHPDAFVPVNTMLLLEYLLPFKYHVDMHVAVGRCCCQLFIMIFEGVPVMPVSKTGGTDYQLGLLLLP